MEFERWVGKFKIYEKPEHFLANINVLLDNYCTDPSKYTFRLTKEG